MNTKLCCVLLTDFKVLQNVVSHSCMKLKLCRYSLEGQCWSLECLKHLSVDLCIPQKEARCRGLPPPRPPLSYTGSVTKTSPRSNSTPWTPLTTSTERNMNTATKVHTQARTYIQSPKVHTHSHVTFGVVKKIYIHFFKSKQNHHQVLIWTGTP